jgi:cardiolipin synthase
VPWLATFSFLAEMEAAGVRVFRYEKGFLHQKVLVVDDYFSGVGTANLDNRSMRLNFEVIAVVLCEDFAKQVEAMLEVDFAHCREVGASDYSSRPWWFRLGVRVARLFSPIL